ncbi:BON domain-containing protein [Motiliproteus sp.]|uniref:BON domain-containing protein n=1 Tax=Motiliproteus sp. TaxID=1898955 RepID=UPI003BA8F49F
MKAQSVAVIVLLSLFGLSGCSNLISATKEEPISEEPTSRTTGSFIDDELIEIKSLVNISKASEELKQSHIAVTSFNGIVLLTGQVPNDNARQLTESVVGEVRKVRKIHNELTVAGPTSAIVRSNDTWLTAKIKAKMLAEQNLKSTRIKVVTENGAVYLLGLVSDDQANLAVEITRNTVGVQKVVKMFEYVR